MKERIIFDTTIPDETDNIGAYLRSADGTLLTHTTIGAMEALDVNIATTDIDIRDLTHVSDSVKIGDGTDFLAINNDGSINVQVAGIDFAGDYAEDSAHVSGDVGLYVLSVREDALTTSTSATGDYQSFKTDRLGRVWVNGSAQTSQNTAVSVGNTATDLVATDLVNRRKIIIQNADSRPIYVGDATVTTATGIRLSGGAVLELEVDATVNLHGITATGTADIRVLEIA